MVRGIYEKPAWLRRRLLAPCCIAMRPAGHGRKTTPSVHALIAARRSATVRAPPPEVAAKLGKRCFVASVDVEAHDWGC